MTPSEIKALWPFPSIEPREVQLEALSAAWEKYGFAYFMRQRLGKTYTAFAEYAILRNQGWLKWFIVICPNSIKHQWYEQIKEVSPYIPVNIYKSGYKKGTRDYFTKNKRGGVLIINYEALHTFLSDWAKDPFFDPALAYAVADESTKIKSPSAKSTKAAHRLADLCSYTRVLTGKPTANTNADLWSQLRFIHAIGMNFSEFKSRYVVMGGFQNRQYIKNINELALKEDIAKFSYIAPDKYIKGFKKIYEPMRRINLTGELETMYDQMENELVIELAGNAQITAPIILTKYLRLQQISSGVAGDVDGNQHNLVDVADNPRIRILREIMDSEITNKVIIACRFRLSVDNVIEAMVKDGHKVEKLVGGMNATDIEAAKRRFNDGDSNVLVAQIQVLSYGHTLPGSDDCPCDSMIFYENDFSLINRMQSESRPEKMGRDIPISYYDMFASKMDRYIISALIRKEDASLSLMGYAREHGIMPHGTKVENKDEYNS